MKGFRNRIDSSKYPNTSSSDSLNKFPGSFCSEPGTYDHKHSKTSLWSGFLVSVFSIFETDSESKDSGKKESSTRGHCWTASVKRVMIGASMRRIEERVLGLNKTGISISSSDIWLLGVCYKISQEYSSADPAHSNGFAAFVEDFESRILMTSMKLIFCCHFPIQVPALTPTETVFIRLKRNFF